MSGYLRQSTASQSRALGPFVSDSDFKTVQTGLTIANTDVKLVINGAASVNKNSGGGTHRVNGVYGLTFDATDTATVGEMEVSIAVSGALIVFDKFTILEEAVYDALFAASAPGPATQTQINTELTATVADSVPADGTRPSIASGIYMLVQFLMERSISGTTMTTKKVDGSTTLMTHTLNSASAPTSVTRAT